MLVPIVPRADFGWGGLLLPLAVAGSGLGLLVSQLNNYTLAPISEERVSEAAGTNSAAGSFGLSFGLAFAGAILLATLSITFTSMAESSDVLPPAEQQRVAQVLEEDAEVMSNTQLEELLAGQPPAIRDEVVRINTDARPLALQVALLVPLAAGLLASPTRSAWSEPTGGGPPRRTVRRHSDGAGSHSSVIGSEVTVDHVENFLAGRGTNPVDRVGPCIAGGADLGQQCFQPLHDRGPRLPVLAHLGESSRSRSMSAQATDIGSGTSSARRNSATARGFG